MKLHELRVYIQAMDIADTVWSLVSNWDYLARDTVGKQWIRSADSIAANISEGYGRYHYKENKQFLFYARGSLFESLTWLEKSQQRKLLNEETFTTLKQALMDLVPQLNSYIKSIGNNATVVKEESADYSSAEPSGQMTNDY